MKYDLTNQEVKNWVLFKYIRTLTTEYTIEVEDDIVRVLPTK